MADEYDVFLSYSSADKPAVEAIALRLRDEAGLRPFLDAWHLVPGEPWMTALERAIERSAAVAVFLGPKGMGPWHEQESQLALVTGAQRRGKRVIPVLLPGTRKEDVDGFLSLRTWVELAEGNGFAALVAGITGRAPGPAATGSKPGARADTGAAEGSTRFDQEPPQGSRWAIQIYTYQEVLRRDAKQILNKMGFHVSDLNEARAMQYGEVCLVGIPFQVQERVREAVEEIGAKVDFESSYAMMEDIVGMNKDRFSLNPEEVDVLAGILSSLSEPEIIDLTRLSPERVKRHLRRLYLALQVETMDGIREAACEVWG